MICPNYKNKETNRQFNEIIEALGGRPLTDEEFRSSDLRNQRQGVDYSAMEAAYKIWHRNNGNHIDAAPNGNSSILFQTLLNHFNGDRKAAIEAKTKVYSDEFINWFGDWINDPSNASKVVDENGEPLVVYHYSDDETLTKFSTDFDNYFSKSGGTKKAIFFTEDNPSEEERGSNFITKRKNKIVAFLNIKDLKTYKGTKEDLHNQGTSYREVVNKSAEENDVYGGVHMEDFDDNKKEHQSIWIIHSPNQVKSATNNNGDFSTTNNGIYQISTVKTVIDKLVPKFRPYRPRTKRTDKSNYVEQIRKFYYNLLGIDLDIDFFDDIELIKDKINHFLYNTVSQEIENKLIKLREEYDKIEYRATEQYINNLKNFLQKKDLSAISEYDEQTQDMIKKCFPNLFRAKTQSKLNSAFGYYIHAINQKNNVYKNIYTIVNQRNIYKIKLNNSIQKLQAVQRFLNRYPDSREQIRNKLFSELDRYKEYSDFYTGQSHTQNEINEDVWEKAKVASKQDINFISSIIQKGKIYSAKDVLSYLRQYPEYKQLCDIIIKSLKKQGDINIFGISDNVKKYGGLYNSEDNAIYINTSSDLYKTDPVHTILHELIHGISVFYIGDNPELVESIETFRKYVEDYWRKGIPSIFQWSEVSPYGISDKEMGPEINAGEFIAEFMSNKEFQNLLKETPAMDEQEFSSLFEQFLHWILGVLGIKKQDTAYDQIKPVVESIIDAQYAIYNNVPTLQEFDQTRYTLSGDVLQISQDSLLYDEEDEKNQNEEFYISPEDTETISELNQIEKNMDSYVVDKIKESIKSGENRDILDIVSEAKREWIEQKQKQILGETQLKLAEAYGLKQITDENGRISFVSENNDEKTNLIISFLDYLGDDEQGYYDYNSKSTAAHHVIAISLTNGDPSTFNHELAHHYLRMFWNSELVQTALAAVDKPGMTDVEREEALVDIITSMSSDSRNLSLLQSQSFVQKFWAALANIMYNTLGIDSKARRNDLYKNITKAFVYNEQQQLSESNDIVFKLANQKKYKKKKKSYRERLSEVRQEGRFEKVIVPYEQVGGNKTQQAIKTILQGTISRNKQYRKNTVTNPQLRVKMQLAEDKVRKFVSDIAEYRKNYLQQQGITKPTFSQKRSSSETQEEIQANLSIISSFLDSARDDLIDLANKFEAAERSRFMSYVKKEIVNPNTGDVTVEYLDISHLNDPDTELVEVTFNELCEIQQNTLGFYKTSLYQLEQAVRDPRFAALYGISAQEDILSKINEIYNVGNQQVSLNGILHHVEMSYVGAITQHVRAFTENYINENTKDLSPVYRQRLIYSVNNWIEDQNIFGDVGALELWIGLASNSKSPLIRIMQDVIDNIHIETNNEVVEKGLKLRDLRTKAINAANKSVLGGKLYGGFSIFNLEKLFMERDENGEFTGNFATKVNKGKFFKDRTKFLDDLLYKRSDSVENKIRQFLNDPSFELEIDESGDPIFPEGCDAIEKEYLHELNHWTGKRAVRRFTVAYYDKRIDTLSSVTMKAVNKINRRINEILSACTIDGKVHTELLYSNQLDELKTLYHTRQQMANPFDSHGNLKQQGTDEYQIAKELSEWNEWQTEHLKYKLDYEAFEEAKNNSKNPDVFERNNTYRAINPKFWEEISNMFPKSTSKVIEDLRKTRSKLISIVKSKGLTYPRIDLLWDEQAMDIKPEYEEFWKTLKHYDEKLLELRNKSMTRQQYLVYKSLVGNLSVEYHTPSGATMSWYTHISQSVTKRIENQYGKNDPMNRARIKKEMEKFRAVLKDGSGNIKESKELSIFSVRTPIPNEITTKSGEKISTVINQPISAYSIIDPDLSDPNYVDTRFDASLNEQTQPITNDTKTEDDQISYTNEDYFKYIENAPAAVKKYYEALVNTMKESYENIPFLGRYDQRLPQEGATTGQMFHRSQWWKPWKPLAYWRKRTFDINESDTDINIDYELRPDGTRSMNIPVRYISRLADPNQINSDIFGSIISFYEMSINYKNKSKQLPMMLTVVDKLNENRRKNNTRDRQSTVLKGLINRQMYDRSKNFDMGEDNLMSYASKKIRRALKWIPGIRAATTTGLLALGWIPAIVAYADPAIQIFIDAVSGKYINLENYAVGTAKMLKGLPLALAGTGKSKNYNRMTAGMQHFGLSKHASYNFRHMDRSQIRRTLQDGILMRFFSLGEYSVNAQVFATVMDSYKYFYDEDTKQGLYMNKTQYYNWASSKGIPQKQAQKNYALNMHTLFNAYEMKEGKYVPKDNKYGKAVTKDLERSVGKRMRNRATVSNLIVPSTERTKIQSNILTAFIVVMRTFMLVGLQNRFKNQRDFQTPDEFDIDEKTQSSLREKYKEDFYGDKGGWNFQTQEIEDGINVAAARVVKHMPRYLGYLWYSIKHPFRSRFSEKTKEYMEENKIAETDIYGIDRILTELLIFGSFVVMQTIFHNKMVDDGDDDDYWMQLIDLLLIRISLTVLTWYSVDTFSDLVNSITPSKSDLDKKFKITDLFKDLWIGVTQHGINFDEWDRVSGQSAYKGDTKAFRDLMYFLSSFGLHQIYSSSKIEGIKSKSKFFKKMVFWRGFWHDAKSGRKSRSTKTPKSQFDNLDNLDNLNSLDNLDNLDNLDELGGL